MTLHDITTENNTTYTITSGGTHIFYFTNKSETLTFRIKHSEARVYIFGSYDMSDTQKCTLSTIQHHTVRGAQSHVLIKSVLRDSARLVYNGMIRVDASAGKTRATLAHHSLLLSNDIFVRTSPQLEVLPSTVSCTHAATITMPNPLHVYYLMSRGIAEKKAHAIIAEEFLNELKQKITEYAT